MKWSRYRSTRPSSILFQERKKGSPLCTRNGREPRQNYPRHQLLSTLLGILFCTLYIYILTMHHACTIPPHSLRGAPPIGRSFQVTLTQSRRSKRISSSTSFRTLAKAGENTHQVQRSSPNLTLHHISHLVRPHVLSSASVLRAFLPSDIKTLFASSTKPHTSQAHKRKYKLLLRLNKTDKGHHGTAYQLLRLSIRHHSI